MRRPIAAPKNLQDFEELCLRLWRDMWGGRVVIDLCDAFLCIHDVHGGRLLPRFSFGLTGNCFASIMTAGA